MDIAAAVDAERLREIIAELVNRTAAVVERYGRERRHQFTGDGIMAMFGHRWRWRTTPSVPALRLWASKINCQRLAQRVASSDGVELAAAGGPEFRPGDHR